MFHIQGGVDPSTGSSSHVGFCVRLESQSGQIDPVHQDIISFFKKYVCNQSSGVEESHLKSQVELLGSFPGDQIVGVPADRHPWAVGQTCGSPALLVGGVVGIYVAGSEEPIVPCTDGLVAYPSQRAFSFPAVN